VTQGLAARLEALAAAGQTISYGALARELQVPGPGAIARLTTALEALMAEDAAQGRPFRAVVCCGRLSGGLPAPGFFEAARRLGRDPGPDPAAYVAAERAALRRG
jgi:hypothetical protein